MAKQIITINPAEKPNLRIGLRWEPRDIDYERFLLGKAGFLKVGFMLFITRLAIERTSSPEEIEELKCKLKLQKKILVNNTPPHNLDLLCFCYDSRKKLTEFISPLAGTAINESLSIFSAGDDPDGVGVMDDEEITVRLKDVPDDIHDIFFAVDSEKHNFSEIKGGVCRATDRGTEQDYFIHSLGNREGEGNLRTFIFARLSRSDGMWQLQQISDYIEIDADKNCPLDDTIDDIIKHRYL